MKDKNFWHKEMYDHDYANSTLNSSTAKKLAKREVDFILENVEILPFSRVLDIPCGTGRHSLEFAKKGFDVTGLDVSEACLDIAKKINHHKKVVYHIGDMKDLSTYKDQFDLVINLFTSFGYFATDNQNKKVLKNLYNCLNDKGTMVLQTVNRDWLLKIFSSSDWHEHKGQYVLNKRNYDPKTHYNQSWMTLIDTKTKEEKTHYHRLRLYSKSELVSLLKDVGFKKVHVYGDECGSKFSKTRSARPFYFATK